MPSKSVQLPVALVARVESFIKSRPSLGYTTTSAFVKACVRRRLKYLKKKQC